MSAIQFKNVSKIYRKGFTAKKVHALKGVTFSVSSDGVTGFVGPNGAGKTTSIKIALGLVRPTHGEVYLRGVNSSDHRARCSTAYVSEQPYLYPYLTVAEHLKFFYRLLELEKPKESEVVRKALERVGLVSVRSRKVRELSKGMQQRLNIAQALLGDPGLIIMDEPMSGLDPLGRHMVRDLIGELSSEGKAIFFSTHVLEDIESLCDRVVALSAGKVVFDGDMAKLAARGCTGVEIVVPSLPENLYNRLKEQGCTILKLSTGAVKLSVGSEAASNDCQRLLHAHDVLPTMISPRLLPLEVVLYQKETKVEAS
ncbi:MAG: ABC transporter ATP-binding protein [Chitinivibrionales bacterium]